MKPKPPPPYLIKILCDNYVFFAMISPKSDKVSYNELGKNHETKKDYVQDRLPRAGIDGHRL